MAAGFKYNLEPEVEQEERYDVETGRRRRGPYKLDTTNLVVGSYLPSFTPIAADLVKKTSQVAIRVEVYEKFTTGSNTTLKIKKRSLAYKGVLFRTMSSVFPELVRAYIYIPCWGIWYLTVFFSIFV